MATRSIPGISASRDVVHTGQVDDRAASGQASPLVARARQGDRVAFALLYARYHPALYRVARFHVPDGPEDVVAETFVRAWRDLPRYRDAGTPFAAWLYGIALHVLDELAGSRRSQPDGEPVQEPEGSERDERVSLAEAMGHLSSEERQVLELKFLIGLSSAEAATAIGRTADAVDSVQWRALRSLRAMLEER
ncbi:MAG TPA: RNA polymerase sigma factor [Actinomycetota bacterium]|nr:RNA polymerase sigma factor [Actinomycetota bacterium]